MTNRPAGPPCGNNPNYPLSDEDRAAVAEFKAYLARQAARTVRLRLGPNAVAMAQRGELITLSGGEADEVADAVLAVLPAPAEFELRSTTDVRAAVLREAADELDSVSSQFDADTCDCGGCALCAWKDAAKHLRRIAEVAPARIDR
ncbi:hypothetical protein [Streptomyces sp. NPDC058045]|uniref:hypothetical protein n=1 Tax=Streptomyces sp. NPDC058045 TaxID=3346311 RepID=UPI0036E3F92B